MLQHRKRVLLVDGNLSYKRLIKGSLKIIEDLDFEIFDSSFLFEAEKIIQNNQIDIVVLDIKLADAKTLNAYSYLHDKYPHITYIVVYDIDNQQLAKDAMSHGAHASIMKIDLESKIIERTMRFAILRHAYQERSRLLKKVL